MSMYIRNRACHCMRCRTRGLTGGAFLVTLGLLILLENFGIVDLGRTFPVLMIVIGLCIIAARTASTEGHIQPFGRAGSATPDVPAQLDPQVKS